jgi:hypothetical protein
MSLSNAWMFCALGDPVVGGGITREMVTGAPAPIVGFPKSMMSDAEVKTQNPSTRRSLTLYT